MFGEVLNDLAESCSAWGRADMLRGLEHGRAVEPEPSHFGSDHAGYAGSAIEAAAGSVATWPSPG